LPPLEQSAGVHLEFGLLLGVEKVDPKRVGERKLLLQEGGFAASSWAEQEKAVIFRKF